MTNAEWLQFLQDLEDLETGLKYVDLSSFEKTLRTARELLVEYRKQSEKRPQGEWIDYNNTFYKCPDCGYLLEKCCPQCQNKVILPKDDVDMRGKEE